MIKKIFLIAMTFLIITAIITTFAITSVDSHFNDYYHSSVEGLREIYGEIIGITPLQVNVDMGAFYCKFKLSSRIRIYCNGMAANWEALLPITKDARFEAKILVNKQNEVVRLEGFYKGEECVIQSWHWDQGRLKLELVSVETQKLNFAFLSKNPRLPDGQWLSSEQVVYILYNRQGEIRAIFLPD